MKIGKEVEGSFQGAVTIFIGVEELSPLVKIVDDLVPGVSLTQKDWERRSLILQHNPEAIYISDLDNVLDYDDTRLQALAKKYEVTLEVTKVKECTSRCVNLMYHVKDPEIWKALSVMARTDQIKFSEGLNVLACAKLNLVETKPEAFQNDIEI